jgi:hypothetical protein
VSWVAYCIYEATVDCEENGCGICVGRPKFVEQICSDLKGQIIWATCPALQGKRLGVLGETDLHWRQVRHVHVGGNTNGLFWVGTLMKEVVLEPKHDPNFRALRDVVSAVEDGLPLTKPPPSVGARTEGEPSVVWYDGFLQENSLLPLKYWDASVAMLSVFLRTGWVSRRLTVKELAVSFNLPVGLHKRWEAVSGKVPFLHSTPTKVLMSLDVALASSLADLAQEPRHSDDPVASRTLPPSLPTAPITQSGVAVKAAKADDAAAEVYLWDAELAALFPKQLKGLTKEKLGNICEAWRNGVMKWWKKHIMGEARGYLYQKYGLEWKTTSSKVNPELGKDRVTIADALKKAHHCTYWDRKLGSTLFFWRWTPEYQGRARDGVKVFIQGTLARYLGHQPKPKDETKLEQVREKLAKVRERGYIEAGTVLSLMGYFDVQKTLFDIRLVYDATKCLLNDAVWAPNFFIPSPDSLYNALDAETWMPIWESSFSISRWTTNHEPLVVGIVFPFVRHRPWQLRNTPKFRAVARKLRSLWKESPANARPFLPFRHVARLGVEVATGRGL